MRSRVGRDRGPLSPSSRGLAPLRRAGGEVPVHRSRRAPARDAPGPGPAARAEAEGHAREGRARPPRRPGDRVVDLARSERDSAPGLRLPHRPGTRRRRPRPRSLEVRSARAPGTPSGHGSGSRRPSARSSSPKRRSSPRWSRRLPGDGRPRDGPGPRDGGRRTPSSSSSSSGSSSSTGQAISRRSSRRRAG